MPQLELLILPLFFTFFVGTPYVNGRKNFNGFKTEFDVASCDREWKENGLTYNHSIFERNNRHAIVFEWVEIFPDACTSKVNKSAVSYYKKQLDKLLRRGIEPVVTLYSGNLPPVFGPLGGWTNPIIIQYFANYARQSFKIFGDRVKTWITFDEPRTICDSFQGLIGDEFPSGVAEYLCAHNILKAHAEVYNIYDKEFRIRQNGKISITLDMKWAEAADASDPKYIRAAERKMHFEFGLYANPILNFDYPPIVRSRVAKKSKAEGFASSRLPEFTYAEKMKISGSYDYLQVKHKGITHIVDDDNDKIWKPSTKVDCGCKIRYTFDSIDGNERWTKKYVCQQMLNWIKTTYSNPKVVLTSDSKNVESNSDKPSKINHKEYLKKALEGVLQFNELLKG